MKIIFLSLAIFLVSLATLLAEDISMNFDYLGNKSGAIKLKVNLVNNSKNDIYIYDTDFMQKNIVINSLSGVANNKKEDSQDIKGDEIGDIKIGSDMALKASISNTNIYRGKRDIKIVLKEGEAFSKIVFIEDDTDFNGTYTLDITLTQLIGISAKSIDAKVVHLNCKKSFKDIKK